MRALLLAALLCVPVVGATAEAQRAGLVAEFPSALFLTDADEYAFETRAGGERLRVVLEWDDPDADLDLRVTGTGPICDVAPCPSRPPCEGERRGVGLGEGSETFEGMTNGFQAVEITVDPVVALRPVAYRLTMTAAEGDTDARLAEKPDDVFLLHMRLACRAAP